MYDSKLDKTFCTQTVKVCRGKENLAPPPPVVSDDVVDEVEDMSDQDQDEVENIGNHDEL